MTPEEALRDPHCRAFVAVVVEMLQEATMNPIESRENSGAVEVLVAHPYHRAPVWRSVRGVARPESRFPECVLPQDLPRWQFLQDAATGYVYAVCDEGEARQVDVDWNPRRQNRGLSVAGSRARRH